MPLFAFEDHEPQVDAEAWIAPTATLVGDVRVEAGASVWYGAVLRADFGPIIVRRRANVQDCSVLRRDGARRGGRRQPCPGAKSWVETNPRAYQDLARRHAASVRQLP